MRIAANHAHDTGHRVEWKSLGGWGGTNPDLSTPATPSAFGDPMKCRRRPCGDRRLLFPHRCVDPGPGCLAQVLENGRGMVFMDYMPDVIRPCICVDTVHGSRKVVAGYWAVRDVDGHPERADRRSVGWNQRERRMAQSGAWGLFARPAHRHPRDPRQAPARQRQVDLSSLYASDLVGRSNSFKRLVEGGRSVEDAAKLTGLLGMES